MAKWAAWAPAKLNLTLDILGRREDGYHELRSIMQTLELADEVSIDDDAEPGVDVSGPYAEGTPADETNLAWRAAECLAQRTSHSTKWLRISLVKHIPAAGGLGGGASDAATTLRLLQRAWAVDDEALREAAAAVGSDEVYFLAGGTALVEGRGQRVTQLAPLPRHGVVLFIPRQTIERKTAQLFEAVSLTSYDSGSETAAVMARLPGTRMPDKLTASGLSNGFERVAYDVFPDLVELRDRAELAIGSAVRLCGAGPTLFWIGSSREADEVAAATKHLDCGVIRTATVEGQWER